ncbi:MAG: glycosyltransferase, partial [Gammaproteobacteria bacterium]|nr:glycosyltransferase [Gammaproteobacteria bacterium]
MTRILFFVSSMQGGGAERVAAILCNRWVENGHEVTLVPTFSERGTCIYPLDKRVRLIFLADRVSTTRKTAWTMARRLWAMRRLVSETGAEVVLSFLPHVNVATLLATRGLGVP